MADAGARLIMRIRNTLAACALVLLTAPVHAQLRDRILATPCEEQDARALDNGAIFDTFKYVGGR